MPCSNVPRIGLLVLVYYEMMTMKGWDYRLGFFLYAILLILLLSAAALLCSELTMVLKYKDAEADFKFHYELCMDDPRSVYVFRIN